MTTPRWGTSEELLLASAVNRYGTTDWDSIAMELKRRCFDSPFPFSSQDCRRQFYDLKRRFMFHDHDDSACSTPMLDELRKIRVEELRREVQRRDVSIVLLESKLKRLQEERKPSAKEELVIDLKDDRERSGGVIKQLPCIKIGNSIHGKDTDDHDKRSFDESNSTKKDQDEQSGVIKDQLKLEPIEPTPDEHGPVRTATESESERKPSSIGDSIKDEEDPDANASRTDGLGNSLESDGEPKREENAEAEEDSKHHSSDVQSSASLSKRKRRRRNGGADATPARRGYSSGEEVEGHKVSPAIKRLSAVKSGPLVKILEIISSHQLSSMIERRLQSQESRRYKSLIRQHIDLEIVKSRLDEGVYSESNGRFFRDLLLLYSNAIVFFPRNSPENEAALELRALVMQKMNDNLNAQQPVPDNLNAQQPVPVKPKSKQEPLKVFRSTKSSTLVACSKGGSAKVISDSGGGKGDKKERDVEEKGKVDNKKEMNGSSMKIQEKDTRAKRATGSNALPGRKGSVPSGKKGDGKHEFGGNGLSSHDALEVKNEKKELSAKQKQGAVRFLKRMKRNSPAEERGNEEGSGSENGEVNGLKEKQKSRQKRKRDENGGGADRNAGGGAERIEVEKKVKRGKGRPPKQPEPKPPETQKGGGGNRDAEETVAGNGGRRPRKRIRKRG